MEGPATSERSSETIGLQLSGIRTVSENLQISLGVGGAVFAELRNVSATDIDRTDFVEDYDGSYFYTVSDGFGF